MKTTFLQTLKPHSENRMNYKPINISCSNIFLLTVSTRKNSATWKLSDINTRIRSDAMFLFNIGNICFILTQHACLWSNSEPNFTRLHAQVYRLPSSKGKQNADLTWYNLLVLQSTEHNLSKQCILGNISPYISVPYKKIAIHMSKIRHMH